MEARWSKLLPELLESISDRLPLHDFIRFRGVCLHWRSSPSGRSEITKFRKDDIWLLFYDFETNIEVDGAKCFLYAKSHPDCCTIRLPHLRGATVVYSKFGWLLAHKNGQFFFYHPLSFAKIDLLKHAITGDQLYSFTTLPTNPHCTVFIASRWKDSALEVSYCAVGDAKWTTNSVNVNTEEIGTMQSLGCYCNCIARVCDCEYGKKIYIYDVKKALVYAIEPFSVHIVDRKVSKVKTNIFKESNDKHRKDWLRRFGEKGFMLDCCAVGAINRNPSVGEVYGVDAWNVLIDNDGEEDKFSLVKAAWIEPIFATKEIM